jgi:branched-chain amino acid transport system ATP-binding protein
VNVALTLAETAYFMEKGQIRFSGPTADLLDRPDILRSVFLGNATTDQERTTAAESTNGIESTNGVESTNGSAPAVAVTAEPEPNGNARGDTPRPLLEVDHVSVSFGGIRAVDGVTMTLGSREIVGIIGPNGAGKTTLLDMISGFTRVERGRVLLAGGDVTHMAPDERARIGLGRSFQDARLFPSLTVAETIAVAYDRWVAVKDPIHPMLRLPAYVDSEDAVATRVDELIALFELEAFRDKFVGELSTGSRRVVDLAAVVAHTPAVLLLDEPSSGIAQRETEALGPLLVRLRDELGCSIVVIEHDMPLIRSISDRLIALESGMVISEGSPDDVLVDPTVVESYLGNTASVIARSGSRST